MDKVSLTSETTDAESTENTLMQIWWLKLAIKTVTLCGCLRLLREQQRNTPLTLVEAIELFWQSQTQQNFIPIYKLLNSNTHSASLLHFHVNISYVHLKKSEKKSGFFWRLFFGFFSGFFSRFFYVVKMEKKSKINPKNNSGIFFLDFFRFLLHKKI